MCGTPPLSRAPRLFPRFTMLHFLAELRRRHVFKAAAAYAVVAWLVVQGASIVFPAFEAPEWVLKAVIALTVLAFPVAVVLAWAFELTPGGVRRTEDAAPGSKDGADEGAPSHARFTPEEVRHGRNRRAARWLAVGILVGLTTVGTVGWPRDAGPPSTGSPGAIRSVAVLPFANVTGNPDDEFFSDGVSEEVLNALSRIEGLRVPARTSSFRFKGSAVDVRDVAEQLGVAAVLEGTVRRVADRVRVSAELVSADDGYQIWSVDYDRQLEDILALQEEIAQAIANALEVELTGEAVARLNRRRTVDPEAYEHYLRGRHLTGSRTREDLERAVGHFEAALAQAPGFAAAYSGLADAYALLEDYGGWSREEAFPKAVAAARRALELDDLQAEAHASLGHIYYHQKNWDAGEAEFRRALELNPSYAIAHHWYGNLLLHDGRPDEAVAALERAHELDPLSPKIREVLGRTLYYARHFERAIAMQEEQLREDPENLDLLSWILSWTYMNAGRPDEALALLERARELHPRGAADGGIRSRRAAALAAAGRREEAAALLGQIEAEGAPDPISESSLAVAYELLGDRERALHWLEVAIERKDWMVEVWRVDPAFDPLRSDPRFVRLVDGTQS